MSVTATADSTAASWLGGHLITLTGNWPSYAMTARLTSSAGTHYGCITGRSGAQTQFFALGQTLRVYLPQVPAAVATFTLEVLDASSTVLFSMPVNIRAPQYGSSTFALRSLLPVNYATGARNIDAIDAEGY